jgi:alpha-tubulin suppressor-like RCC1 family protein
MKTGGVKCWGDNYFGQLGDGSTTTRLTPVDAVKLASGVGAISASAGAHACALMLTGEARCWGDNFNGQLGDGTTTNRHTPTKVKGLSSGVSALLAGGWHTCALWETGAVKCWGRNLNGELGDGTTTDRHTPVSPSGLRSGVSAIYPGYYHTCALMQAGGVKCWGKNEYGQLGDGTTTDRHTPVDVIGLE